MADGYKCKNECLESGLSCEKKTCKHWIEYDQDLNCSLVSIDAHGPMTLDEISKRMGLSLVRIKQIEEAALIKVRKRNQELIKELLHE
jgi:hypothetical protein